MSTRAPAQPSIAEGDPLYNERLATQFTEYDPEKANAMLDETFATMREETCPAVPVLSNGEIIGVVNLENIGEWMMIQSATQETRSRGDVDDVYSAGNGPTR